MKRILSFILLLIICALTFTACQMPEQIQNVIDKIMGKEEPVVEVTYDLDGAVKYLTTVQYKNWISDNSVLGDMDLVGQIMYKAQKYTVTWATESKDVTLTANEDGTTKLAIPERGDLDISFSLTATVQTPDGESKTHTFELKVPMLSVLTHEQYIAAEDGDLVDIVGIITVAHSRTENENCYNEMFLQDLNGNGGYYVYQFADSADTVKDLDLKPGMIVRVSGTKAIYNKTHEIKNATVKIVDSSINDITTYDLTDKYTAANDAEDASITNYLGCLVTLKGVTIGGNDNNADGTPNKYYYYFTLDGLQTYIRLSLSCGLPKTDVEGIQNGHKDHYGWIADITGLVNVYNGVFYIVPVDVNAIDYKSAPSCVHEGGTATCLEEATCTKCGEKYGDKGAHVGGTATCTTYATCTVCEQSYGNLGAHTFTEGVCSCGVTNVLSTDKEYYLGMYQGKKADVYYFIGEMANSYYYGTSTEVADAVKVKLEAVEGVDGAYHITFTVDGAKKYLSVTERTDKAGSATITIVAEVPANYFTYDTTYNTFVTTFAGAEGEVSFFLGNYNTNTSLSGSATKYLADGNFVASLYVVSESTEPEQPEEPAHTCADADGDYVCDTTDCGKVVAPAEGSTLTIEQALKLGALFAKNTYTSGKYYVTGTIKNVYDTTYGNMYITDGTNELCVYGLYSEDGNTRYDAMEVKPVAGDTVTVYGVIGAYNAAQMKDGWLTAHTPAAGEGGDDTTGDDDTTGGDNTTITTYEYTFVKGVYSGDGTVALGDKNWTLATVTSSGNAPYFGWDSNATAKGVQFGKSADHLTSMTLTSETFNNVTKIVINTSGASGINGSFEVYVGDTKIGDTTTLTTTATDYTFECSSALSGAIKIVYTNSAKAIYVKSISVEYAG